MCVCVCIFNCLQKLRVERQRESFADVGSTLKCNVYMHAQPFPCRYQHTHTHTHTHSLS